MQLDILDNLVARIARLLSTVQKLECQQQQTITKPKSVLMAIFAMQDPPLLQEVIHAPSTTSAN
jgi:hypothetical protein